MSNKNEKPNIVPRPPVVVVMGHIDHGKSTLLDYIRKTNIVESETGGITQNISAYEVEHEDGAGQERKITFLDTPGHEAFSGMRERGAGIADIAILVVSAEDGVKPQTIEAWKTVVTSRIPAIVAINKIDKPQANVEKTKVELAENEIYLENYGGSIPYVEISAKTGQGIDALLSLILLVAEMEELRGNPETAAEGHVIEVNLDSRRGIMATLIVKNGTLRKGMTVAAENALCSTRIMENFLGAPVDEVSFSSPLRLVGWDIIPRVGAEFIAFDKKREAEEYAENWETENRKKAGPDKEEAATKKILPIVLKADVWGSIEAIEKELSKIKSDSAEFRVVAKGIGPVSESDIKNIASGTEAIVLGFNVKTDKNATELAEQREIPVNRFDIIYKLTEWLESEMEKRRPKVETEVTSGKAKILRSFSRTKEKQIVGGKVIEGVIALNSTVKILRRDFEIGRGKITNLEKNKAKTSEVSEGSEFGMMIESKIEIAAGDTIEAFTLVQK